MAVEKTMIWILFYYNSLPDMPKGCRLFLKAEIMHRDFFKCNPTNTGHYQYPKFESLSYDEGCHGREVRKFLARREQNKYVVFYTRHTTLSRKNKSKIIGYFKVGRNFEKPRKGFFAAESVLLPKDKCIEIDYNARGVPVSWGHLRIKNRIDGILEYLRSNQAVDISKKYKNETLRIMKRLKTPKGRKQVIEGCQEPECSVAKKCYWGKKPKRNKEEMLRLYSAKRKCR